MRKHPRFVFRTIKHGRITWDHRQWNTTGDVSHIEGKRLVFATYAPEYELLELWGTIEYYKCKEPDSKEGNRLWGEVCEIMGDEQYNDDDDFVTYSSSGIEWWNEV